MCVGQQQQHTKKKKKNTVFFTVPPPHFEQAFTSMEDQPFEDLNDPICAVCETGGDMICCDGKCLRSFHPKCIGVGYLYPLMVKLK